MKVLGYSKWENFYKVIKSAMMACENSSLIMHDHFPEVRKMVGVGSNTHRKILDYKLSRYACYLIAQNGDSRKGNYSLNRVAKKSGVKNFDKFHNYGYRGLYNELTANDIAKRKNLRYREEILDNMGSDELIINLFRISQIEQKLKNDNINGENKANIIHYKVGSKIRDTIKELGGILPEEFPIPEKSLKQIEKENKIFNRNNLKLKNEICRKSNSLEE